MVFMACKLKTLSYFVCMYVCTVVHRVSARSRVSAHPLFFAVLRI